MIWDVHEDTAAALSTKPWLPRPLRPPAAVAVHTAERMAERYVHLILAERGYVTRFSRPHPVVPNTTYVPDLPAPPGRDRRVVYVGHLSPDRGTADMIELARLLRPRGITVELIGPADVHARAQIEPAQAAGLLHWRGFVPNDQAMSMLDGALAGLSLLHDEPNFRHSLPTKLVEYMARGVPVVTTPLPVAAELARGHECGFVVPFGDPRAAADAVLRLDRDICLRAEMGRRGHEAAAKSLGWPSDAREFVTQLESWAKVKLPARHLPIGKRLPFGHFAKADFATDGKDRSADRRDPNDPMTPMTRMTPMALMARTRTFIGRNLFFAAALAAGAGLRLLTLLGYPGALWFSGDSYVYLGAALRPRPDLSKTTGYSLFLRALEPFGSLTLVAGLQHLMGLGTAVMIYLLLRRADVPPRWATAATLPVLFDGFEIEDEHMIMAEALFTFLVMLALLLMLWRVRISWRVALLAGLLAGYAVDVRSQGLPVLVLFPAFLLLRALPQGGWRNWRGWLAAIAMVAGCAAPVLGYAAWFHARTGTFALTRSDGFYLWGRVSSFAECPVIRPPAGELKICPSGAPSSRTPPGDYIWHAPQVHDLTGGPVSVANNALLRDFAIRAVEAQPLGYLHTVLSGLALAVEWPRRPYPDSGTVYYYYFHLKPQTIPASRSWIPGGTAYSDAAQYGHATPSRVVEPFATLIAGYERVFYTYGPLFGLILVMGLGGVVRLQRRPLRLIRLARSRRAGSMLPWVTAVVLLVFPIAIADFDYRYLLPVLPFACLAAGLAFAPAREAVIPDVPARFEEDQLTADVPGPAS